ncbi:MAG: ribbon-helix-helix protein, CopG family [Candidatus Melainabacteria bacterium]|nr:ribbon-helix-helix protein, CopG family [Candidatus Melainabacteria bacterium]
MAKVLISMQEDFLEKVDAMADKDQRSRSEFIRQALRVYIRRRRARSLNNVRYTQNAELLESLLLD